jgi:hypothetical protein
MCCDDLIEIFDRRRCDNDCRHESELCQRDSLACTTLPQSLLRSLERTRDRIEERCDTRRIRIDLIERSCQQRACERARIDVRSRRERAQLRRVLLIELDVEPGGLVAHNSGRYTGLHETCYPVYDAPHGRHLSRWPVPRPEAGALGRLDVRSWGPDYRKGSTVTSSGNRPKSRSRVSSFSTA